MPDWKQYVREHLAGAALPPEREEAIVAELAQHLEAAYDETIRRGDNSESALRNALAQIPDWRVLESEIRRAERPLSKKILDTGSLSGPQAPTKKRRWNMFAESWQDIRYGIRILLNKPGFALVAVVTLALGIGANTAIFSVVNGVLLRPLPFREPGRLVLLWNQILNDGLPQLWLSQPELLDYRERQNSLEGIAVYGYSGRNLTTGGDALRVSVVQMTANMFPLLGVEARMGQVFTETEDAPGADGVVLLSDAFWRSRFGADEGIIGKTLTIDGAGVTVMGVMPASFTFPDADVNMWAPIAIDPANLRSAGSHYLTAVARLKDGVTLEQANADIKTMAVQYALDTFQGSTLEGIEQRGWGAYLQPLQENLVGDVKPALLTLLGAVGFVLLIACANVANLMLARATSREKEIALRSALGAGRIRIVRQLLTESLMLALLGGAFGLLLAWGAMQAILGMAPDSLPRQEAITLDIPVLGFTLALTLLTGILFGLFPALRSARADLHMTLKEGGRSGDAGGRSKVRNALVVAEVALAVVLLIGAGLLIQSFSRLMDVNPGYQTKNVLSFRIALPGTDYPEQNDRVAFFRDALAKIRTLPGVTAAGAITNLPLANGNASGTMAAEGVMASDGDGLLATEIDYRAATPGYTDAMGIAVLRGRWFVDSDDGDAPLVAVVDETFVKRFWPDGDNPIGRRITTGGGMEPTWRTIVGVVRHVKHYGLGTHGREQSYFPQAQVSFSTLYLTVRTAQAPSLVLNSARREIASLNPTLPIYSIRTMQERVGESVAQERFNMSLLGLFASVALLLAGVGIYGVISYSVSQRTHEIGIRMALGAHRADVMKMVFSQALVLIAIGTGSGLIAAYALMRVVSGLLFGITPLDIPTYIVVPAVLGGVALLASYIPARRAMRVDPMVALRYE